MNRSNQNVLYDSVDPKAASGEVAAESSSSQTVNVWLDQNQNGATLTVDRTETGYVDPNKTKLKCEDEWVHLVGGFGEARERLNALSKRLIGDAPDGKSKRPPSTIGKSSDSSEPLLPAQAAEQQQTHPLKEKIDEAHAWIKQAEEAAERVKEKDGNTEENRKYLEALIGLISKDQSSIKTKLPVLPDFNDLNEITTLLAGLAGLLWTFLLTMGILAATSSVVTWGPLAAGLGIISIRCGEFVQTRIILYKSKDALALIGVYDLLVSTLRKIREKMEAEALIRRLAAIDKRLEQIFATDASLANPAASSSAKAPDSTQANGEAIAVFRTKLQKWLDSGYSKQTVLTVVLQTMADDGTSKDEISKIVNQVFDKQVPSQQQIVIGSSNKAEPTEYFKNSGN